MDDSIKKAEERLEYLSSDPSTIELYRKREESLHERANMISSAMERGMEKGIKKGKIEVAKNLLNLGVDASIISSSTGLTEEEIEELKRIN